MLNMFKWGMNMRPMRAVDADLDKLRYPLFLFPKIDGLRGIILEQLYTRTMRSFSNIYTHNKFNQAGYPWFDSELTLGPDWTLPNLVTHTNSALMSHEGEPDIRVNVFDYLVKLDQPYHKRYDAAIPLVEQYLRDGVELFKMIPYVECQNKDDVQTHHKQNVEKGYEGSVLRDPLAAYKEGTSTVNEGGYLRLKDFTDTEGVVIGVIEGKINNNPKTLNKLGLTERSTHKANMIPSGMIGTLIVKNLYTGQIQDVSPGTMTHAERVFFFLNQEYILGKIIKYQFFNYAIKDKPRFPTFQSFRDLKDIILPNT